ncbi:MAG: SOS response-associated peptidase family protein, partial [Burkholderiales bacterium]
RMCNRYTSPADADMERFGQLRPGQAWRQMEIFPRRQGPFIRHDNDGSRELVIGQWGLIPWFARAPRLAYSTNNARFEELASKASFRGPRGDGKRCIIPALSFVEPNWEQGRCVWWSFRRIDGKPWGLAGLWNTWTDRASGEVYESYSMLTVNADDHPLMSRMHKPDPNYGPDEQDKRSVVAIERANVDRWLEGTVEEAGATVAPPRVELIEAACVT